ncbi:hypothetical protein J5J83_20730 [Azoarcus sp. L1K30]|uniref:DUF1302 family protein n=1 Tax=Azoarcus sp. L1K30 TaxID=2820277 RepID=UPI001B8433DB|nr:DUF1302 family protein [Azoarcus sp. L1K30]MBR0568557.1 hypothetical protein [Azoarcus sp. L1K30]
MRVVKGMLVAAACAASTLAAAGDDPELDALFDIGASAPASGSGIALGGYAEFSGAYTTAAKGHWSKLRARTELSANGNAGGGMKWRVTGRLEADAAQNLEGDFYPDAVRRDQRTDAVLREAYLDLPAGDWEFRFGRQQVVWGEMVGFFFADVVSARDLREFLLPEFESLRIPQWAARAEYFGADTHFELLWVPVASYDRIGKPGADFYPYPAQLVPSGVAVVEKKPDQDGRDGNWGLRASRLIDGWDLSAFYYDSRNVEPSLYRVSFAPAYELRHDRIRQFGGTFSKDMGPFVLKGEVVHASGRRFISLDPNAPFGLRKSDTLDYAVGVDVPVGSDWRFNVQYFERLHFNHADGMLVERNEPGATFQAVHTFGSEFEFEFLAASSLIRRDFMLRPKLTWKFAPEWRALMGVDYFEGRHTALFGRFDDSDRVYFEVRRWF